MPRRNRRVLLGKNLEKSRSSGRHLSPIAMALVLLLVFAVPAHPQGVISTVAGNGTPGYSGDGGPATSAKLSSPDGVAVDSAGNLYIADYLNKRIRKVSPQGIITTVAGNGTAGYSGDGGPAASAQLVEPSGVAVDSTGNLYIAEYGDQRIRKVSAVGIITTVAGNGAAGYSGDGGPATSAKLYFPGRVAVDSVGNLYIADSGNLRIRKVNPQGIISTVAGNGTPGYSGDGGPATSAKLFGTSDVAVDLAGNLYIPNHADNRIRKVNPEGIISTVAGNGTPGYSGDGGPATSAKLSAPDGVAVDSAGNLYIADDANNRIRMVSPQGVITTVAGNGILGYSGDGGPATSAKLSLPAGVAVDLLGNLYITEGGNGTVRKVLTPALGMPTVAPVIPQNGVVNGASFTPAPAPVAPGSIISVFGTNLSIGTAAATSLPLPTTLGAQLLINGTPAPLFYVSPTQINAQLPWEVADKASVSVSVALPYNGLQSAPAQVNLAENAPGIFTTTVDGTMLGAVLHASSGALVTTSNPAVPAEYLGIYASGLGPVSNQPPTGNAASATPFAYTLNLPTVTLGGVPAAVSFSGLAPGFVGLYQVNVQVPNGALSGPQPLRLVINGVPSNAVTLAVQ